MAHGHPDYQAISTPTLPDFGEGQVSWFQSETKEVTAGESYDLISYVVPDDMELRVCSGIVSCEAPRTQRFNFVTTPAGDWVSPTSHIDPDEVWQAPEAAYDNNIYTLAGTTVAAESWSSYLILLVNETNIDKVRFMAPYATGLKIDVDVYYEGAWHDVYEGAYTGEWDEKAIPGGVKLISKARIRFYNSYSEALILSLNEFMFDTAEETPQETIYFDTYAIIPYLPEAPYPVPSRATFVLRVYNDDEDAQNMSVNLAGFLQTKV